LPIAILELGLESSLVEHVPPFRA